MIARPMIAGLTLSKRQHAMLRMFVSERGAPMTEEQAQAWDQRPFRSLLMRKWVAYRPGRGFEITRTGLDAWQQYNEAEIRRRDASRPLTAYFDPAAYVVHRGPRLVPRGAAAA